MGRAEQRMFHFRSPTQNANCLMQQFSGTVARHITQRAVHEHDLQALCIDDALARAIQNRLKLLTFAAARSAYRRAF